MGPSMIVDGERAGQEIRRRERPVASMGPSMFVDGEL